MSRWILLSIVVGLSVGCAHTSPRIVIAPPPPGQRFGHKVLDVPINELTLDRVPVLEAIEQIAAEVHRVYHNDVYFQVAVEYSHAHIPFSPKVPISADDLQLHDPRVSLHLTNVPAREALTHICRQAGWSYRQMNANQIMFRDGPPLPQEKAVGRDGFRWYPPEVR